MSLLLANVDGLCTETELPSDGEHLKAALLEASARVRAVEESQQVCLGVRTPDKTSPVMDQGGRVLLKALRDVLHERCGSLAATTLIPRHFGTRSIDELRERAEGQEEKIPQFQNKLLLLMDQVLDRYHAVAIGYGGYLVTDRAMGDSDATGDHAAVISGRKKINGRCFYQLRNSWGKGCDLKEPFKSRCSEGLTWVTAPELKAGGLNSIDFLL